MRKFLGGMALATILKLVFYIVSTAIKLIANIMVFFGLYVPFFYLIYGELLILFAGFTITPYTSNLGLFLFGLVICMFCSIIITIRNMIIKPVKAVFGRNDKNYQIDYDRRPIRRPPPIRYYGGDYPRPKRYLPPPRRSEQYGYLTIDSPTEYIDRFDKYYEHPEIYRSEVNQDLIIYEYSDRFEIYEHNGNNLDYVETKYR